MGIGTGRLLRASLSIQVAVSLLSLVCGLPAELTQETNLPTLSFTQKFPAHPAEDIPAALRLTGQAGDVIFT
jgi:hypothetical protein